jgi:hypothetical protein
LRAYLGKHCFPGTDNDGMRPTQYDSPTAFSAEVFREHAQVVSQALANLERQLAEPSSR